MSSDYKFTQFFNALQSLIEMDSNEILYYGELLSVVSYKKGKLLLEAGETCRNIFLTIQTPNRHGELPSAGVSRTLAF